MLLLGNLLSFYEQQKVFDERRREIRPYNLERPLWVFVGSRVNAVYSEKKRRRSDVLTVVRFLHRVLRNEGGWVVDAIGKFIDGGETGLETSYREDVFRGKFGYVRESGLSSEEIYREILSGVFHAPSSGGLRLCGIRGSAGVEGVEPRSPRHRRVEVVVFAPEGVDAAAVGMENKEESDDRNREGGRESGLQVIQ